VLTCLFALLTSPVWAARLESKDSTLRILQKQGRWELEYNGDVVASGSDLGQQIDVSIEKGETIAIVVGDQNPLLYTYTKDIQTTDTDDFSAASGFAAELAKLVGLFTPPPGGAAAPMGGQPPDAGCDTPDPALAEAKKALAFVESNVATVRQALEAIPGLLVASASTDAATVSEAKQTVASWNLELLTTNLDKGWPALDQTLRTLNGKNDCHVPVYLDSLRLQSQRGSVDRGLERLEAFAPLMAKVDSILNLASIDYTANSKNTVTVQIAVNSANARLAKTVNLKAQNVKIVITPYSPIRLGFGGAAVYSFVDDPSFATEQVDEGFKIVEKSGSDDFVGQKVAAMLTLIPRAWDRGPLAGELFIGINPESEAVGLFLGGGIRFSQVFSFGLGITFQEVRKLGAGLEPGTILKSADQLKLDTEYDTGFFLSISATTK
jgi:hypothetical protein